MLTYSNLSLSCSADPSFFSSFAGLPPKPESKLFSSVSLTSGFAHLILTVINLRSPFERVCSLFSKNTKYDGDSLRLGTTSLTKSINLEVSSPKERASIYSRRPLISETRDPLCRTLTSSEMI